MPNPEERNNPIIGSNITKKPQPDNKEGKTEDLYSETGNL
jgi:hypothetical protein